MESRVGVPVASDDAHALDVVATLVRDVGIDPVVGRLTYAGWLEGGTSKRLGCRWCGSTACTAAAQRRRHRNSSPPNAHWTRSSSGESCRSMMRQRAGSRVHRGSGSGGGCCFPGRDDCAIGLRLAVGEMLGSQARASHSSRVRHPACAESPDAEAERILDHRKSRCLATRHSICRGVRDCLTCGRSRRDARLSTPLLDAAAS